nr:MAG TPA: hypothetical protein [Caudoviricetes sp.]
MFIDKIYHYKINYIYPIFTPILIDNTYLLK